MKSSAIKPPSTLDCSKKDNQNDHLIGMLEGSSNPNQCLFIGCGGFF